MGYQLRLNKSEASRLSFPKRDVESSKKVYLLIHADKMSVSASNSLLKFLEEPNPRPLPFY